MSLKNFLASLALLSVLTASLSAAPLFVLHDGASSASVFDSQTLEPLGSAPAPAGVFRVFGLPDRPGSDRAVKFYLIGSRAIVVTDGDYGRIGEIELPAPAIRAPHGAALSADGRRLLVATRFGVLLIDTAEDRIVARLVPGFPTAGVALLPDPNRAWVIAEGAALARSIELDRDRLGLETALPPAPLTSVSGSANGLLAFGFGSGGVYDLTSIETVVFSGATDAGRTPSVSVTPGVASRLAIFQTAPKTPPVFGRAPAGQQLSRLVVTDSGRFFLAAGDVLTRASVGADSVTLIAADPVTGVRLDPRRTAWTPSRDGSRLFLARSEDRTLYAFDPAGTGRVESVALSAAPTGVELVIPRLRQAGLLELLTTNNVSVAGGTPFDIMVRATDGSGLPVSNVPVFASNVFPDMPMISCLTGLTDGGGEATLECSAGEVTEPATVQITISDAEGRSAPIFSVQAQPPTPFEGLAKIEGDGQRVPVASDFSFVVQLSRNRLPAPGVGLLVATTPLDPEVLTCPTQVSTGDGGQATITCTAAEVVTRKTVSVEVSDGMGDSVTFSAVIDPRAAKPTGLSKVAGDEQIVSQGANFTLVVESRRDGEPRANTILNIIVMTIAVPPLATCPTNAMTDENGRAAFICKAGTIFGDSATVEITVADFGVRLPEPFKVLINRTGQGVASGLELLSEEDFEVVAGEPLVDGIRVRAVSTIGGSAVQNVEVFFSSADDVVFDPPVVRTDSAGIATTTVTVGCNDNRDAVILVQLNPDILLLDLKADIQPGRFAKLIKTRGDNQSGGPGQRLTQNALVAVTTDACGNVFSGQEVEWRVRPAYAASLGNVVSISDSQGRVSVLATLGQFGGPLQVEVGNETATTQFDLAVSLPVEGLRIRSGDGQNALTGQALAQPLVVQALGITGFGVGGVPVVWNVVDGPAQILNRATMTDNAGIAFARIRLGTAANPQQGSGPRAQIEARAMGDTVTFFVNGEAKPIAPIEAFVNGASFVTGWTPGAAGSIFGEMLAPELTVADQAPFPTNLGGVSVTVNGVPAPLIFVSPGQVNVQVPFETPLGPTTVIIDNNGRQATVENVVIERVRPGIFEINIDGQRIAAALHQDFSLIRPSSPAIPGEVVQLFFTGAGPLNAVVGTNQPGPIPPALTTIEVVIGVDGEGQESFGAFYAPQLISANQVNFRLGSSTPAGMRNLSLVMQGVASKTVFLPVGSN